MLDKIDHLGIAVDDLDSALAVYSTTLGLSVKRREVVEEQGVELAALIVGETLIELLRPLSEDTPVGRFLSKRGPGLHHVAYRVDDIEAALAALREAGARLIDEIPRRGMGGSRIAFVHPSATTGVLTELVEPPTAADAAAAE